MSDVRFGTPPLVSRQRRSKWGQITETLAKNPGKWALVGENVNTGMAHYLRHQYGCEVMLRDRLESGRYAQMWARYAHGSSPAAAEPDQIDQTEG